MFQFTQAMWDAFNAHNIIKQNPHIVEEHVGKTKEYIKCRAHKMGHNAATFYSYESINDAAEAFLFDEKNEQKVEKYMHFNEEFEVYVKCDRVIGLVAEPDGKLCRVRNCRIVCRFYKNTTYRNEYTNMPFDIVTMYPVRQNEKN